MKIKGLVIIVKNTSLPVKLKVLGLSRAVYLICRRRTNRVSIRPTLIYKCASRRVIYNIFDLSRIEKPVQEADNALICLFVELRTIVAESPKEVPRKVHMWVSGQFA